MKVSVFHIGKLTDEEYALARKKGLGASDASVMLGQMTQFGKDKNSLIQDKLTLQITEEDRAISQKESVRKGRDLEALIIQKAAEQLGKPVHKPLHMYRHTQYPYLTVNFDGVTREEEDIIPVECKFVTSFGDKYYNREDPKGIPNYYYTQLQQQMLFLDAPYGYLAALFDKGWIFHMFKIPRDEQVIKQIIVEGYKVWMEVERRLLRGKQRVYTLD